MRAIRGRAVNFIVILAFTLSVAKCAHANSQDAGLCNHEGAQLGQQSGTTGAAGSQSDPQDKSQTDPSQSKKAPDSTQQPPDAPGQQTNRILGVMPNYRAVSANTQLPPLSVGGKFILATKDSVDYTSILFAGALAGVRQAQRQDPEFGNGPAGYGRYFWRSFADQAVGNYFTEAIFASVTREDPRYYTLARGGIWHRTVYAFSRILITKNDSGSTGFNYSEIIGNGVAAGIGNLYYPAQDRTLRTTGVNWGEQVLADGIANVVKEFWPDLHDFMRRKKLPQP